MSYKNTIREIDNDYDKIKDFDNDTLFINIYYFGVLQTTSQCIAFGEEQP